MAFRAKEAAIAFGLTLSMAAYGAEVSVPVRHDHVLLSEGAGTLAATDTGLSFKETGKRAEHGWTLAWEEIQQLWISPKKVRVLSYADTWWKLGADREYELEAAPGANFEILYSALKARLDQRLVAALADAPDDVLWRVPAKLRRRFGGPEGVLVVASDRIVFDSPESGQSRTWRMADLDSISSSGSFEVTLTTYERSRGDYGERKAFTFQLKQPVSQSRYNELWRRLNRSKQLDFINSSQERQQ